MGRFDGCFAWIKVVCEQLGYWVPGPAQCEAIISVDAVLVESYLDFNNISVLDRALGYMDCLIKEAIQIRLNQNNNRDNGFTLSRAWNPVTKLLFTHNLDPGKAAIEPAHRPVP
jgi:hypothetical protein